MTTENDDLGEVIAEVQREMDSEQGLEQQPASATLTADQVQQMIEAQSRSLQSQISGLQGYMSKGLNSIREDTQSWAKQEIGDLRSAMGQEQWLASLDDDQRNLVQPLLAELTKTRQMVQDRAVQQPAQAEQPVPDAMPQPQQQNVAEEWERIYVFVESMGLGRNDPNVNYNSLTDQSVPAPQRETNFIASVRSAMQQQIGGASPEPPGQNRQRQRTDSPPVESGPAGGATAMNSVDDVRSAYIENKISQEEYRSRLAALGEPVQ